LGANKIEALSHTIGNFVNLEALEINDNLLATFLSKSRVYKKPLVEIAFFMDLH
jgi:hypothetical protein